MRMPRFTLAQMMCAIALIGCCLGLAVNLPIPVLVASAVVIPLVILFVVTPTVVAWRRYSSSRNRIAIAVIVFTALSVVVLLPGIFAIFFAWLFGAHGLSDSAQVALHPGLTRQEVRSVAGQPSFIDGGMWCYERQTWCIVKVTFGNDGRATGIYHDH